MAKTTVTIHRAKVISVCGPMVDQAAYRAAQKTRGYVISEIRAADRVKTGRMIALMQARRVGGSSPMHPRYGVSSTAKYTMYQNDGTRAHGPRTAKVMRFQPKGGGGFVYAKWVRGVTPARFYEKGLARVRVNDFLS